MTNIEIYLKLEAGQGIDHLVAKNVLGLDDSTSLMFCPNFSTDMTQAWKIVERLSQIARLVNISIYDGLHGNIRDRVVCEGEIGSKSHPNLTRHYWADAPTAPLAICRAALCAVAMVNLDDKI